MFQPFFSQSLYFSQIFQARKRTLRVLKEKKLSVLKEALKSQSPPNNSLADSQVEDLQNREYTRNPFLRLPLLGCNMLIYQITHKHILYAMHQNNPNT